MPLAPFHLLAAVVAARAPNAGGLDGLTVDDARAGLRVAPQAHAQLLTQDRVNAFPRAIQPPLPEIVVNGLITNDKCCLTRYGRLALTWPRSHPLPRTWKHAPPAYAPRDDSHRRGGRHASPARAYVAPPSSAVPSPGRAAALGSSVSAPAAVDAACARISTPASAADPGPTVARPGGGQP